MKPPPRRFAKPWRADPSDYSAHFNWRWLTVSGARRGWGLRNYRRTLELEGPACTKPSSLRHAAAAAEGCERAGVARSGRRTESSANSGRATTWRKPRRRQTLSIAPKPATAGHRAGSEVRRRESGLGRLLAREGKLADATPHYRPGCLARPQVPELDAGVGRRTRKSASARRGGRHLYRDFADDPAAQRTSAVCCSMVTYRGRAGSRTAYASEPSQLMPWPLGMHTYFPVNPPRRAPAGPKGGWRRRPANFELRYNYRRRPAADSTAIPALSLAQFADSGKNSKRTPSSVARGWATAL